MSPKRPGTGWPTKHGLRVESVPIDEFVPRIWELRSNVSAYDAAHVAIAEERQLQLITSDARLARPASPYCAVELVR